MGVTKLKTEEILNEREKTHGDFDEVSIRYREIKRAALMDFTAECMDAKDEEVYDRQFLALEMILLKIARIVCGDPNFADHWDDIAGYAMLGKGKKEGEWTEFEKQYCVPLDGSKGVVHFWKEGAAILDRDCMCVTFNGMHHHTCKKFIKEKPKEKECGCKVCFECAWLAKCSICRMLLPPKPYPYLNGKPVHAACYNSEKEESKEEWRCKELEEMTRLMQEAAMEHVDKEGPCKECALSIEYGFHGVPCDKHIKAMRDINKSSVDEMLKEEPKCNMHIYQAQCTKPRSNCRCLDCMPICNICGKTINTVWGK